MTLGGHRLAAALVAGLLLCAGCSDDPQPKLSPPEPSSSAADPTPPREPKEPWEKRTDAGAVAFAEHWFEVFNDAQRTGETDDLAAISGNDCGTCQGIIEQLNGLYGAGGSMESDGWQVVSAVPAEGIPAHQARVSVRIDRAAQEIRYGDGRATETFPPSKVTMSARLGWQNSGWIMNDLVALQ